MGRIAILGGTGPEGMGLALRFARCGEEIVIGSRQQERALAAAVHATQRLRAVGCDARVQGATNDAAVRGADLVVVALPYDGVSALLTPLAPALAGITVLEVVNPLVRRDKTFVVAPVPDGS